MGKPALRVVASTRPKLVRDPLAYLARSFERSLRAKNRSEHTIASYREAVHQFGEFLKASHRPQDPAQVRRADVELFVQHLLAKFKPSTASPVVAAVLSVVRAGGRDQRESDAQGAARCA